MVYLDLHQDTIARIYRRLGFTLNLQGHDVDAFKPQLPEDVKFAPPLPTKEEIEKYTVPAPLTQATQPDPNVAVAQARLADRAAMRDNKADMEEIALARRHHDQNTGKRVHPKNSTNAQNSPKKRINTNKAGLRGEEPSDSDDSGEATEEGATLEDILAQGWKLVSKCPSLKPSNFSSTNSKHINKHFVRKFELDGGRSGWCLAQVTRPADKIDAKKGFNCNVLLSGEKWERAMLLTESEYYTENDSKREAPVGSWCFVRSD